MITYNSYPYIDLVKTGGHLKRLVRRRRYSVREIQALLHLSCPQPVYRWFKGQALPSVDHLYVLSKLLGVHMEELVVPGKEEPEGEALRRRQYLLFQEEREKQIMRYWKRVQQAA
ncbi:hypothetical protein IMSAGC019_00975 [Lachnospiraceae bacterium]|nr:hypothetical protein IMSAGC019_00975 [Lachnospiraceae bacterium]